MLYFSAFFSAHAQQTYDLEALFEQASTQLPQLRAARLEEKIQLTEQQVALSGWWPRVGVEADYLRFFQQPVAIFPDFNNPESGEFQEVETGVPFNSTVNAFVEQPLLNNRLIQAKQQQNVVENAQRAQLETLLANQQKEIARAFYRALEAQEEILLRQEDLTRQKRQLRDAEALVRAGLRDRTDIKRAEIALLQTEAALFEAEQQEKAAKTLLVSRVGLDPALPFTLQADPPSTLLQPELEEERFNWRNRPEYRFYLASLEQQRVNLAFAKRQFLPDISAFFNYNLLFQTPNGPELFNQAFPNSLTGFRFSLPLFTGNERNLRIRQARFAADQQNEALRQLELDLLAEEGQASASYLSAFKQVETQRKIENLAEEVFSTIQLQYEQGIVSFLEVIQAETDLATARITALSAYYRFKTAEWELRHARGTLDLNRFLNL
ncbi:MAG: TolC family protein [Nitritalea sp.]